MTRFDHIAGQSGFAVAQTGSTGDPFVSVVVPARNEAQNVPAVVERVSATLAGFTDRFEIIFICDGYGDSTVEAVQEARRSDDRIKLLHLSRSFGHQNAVLAGLDHASGQVVVTMDGDLQHPPESIADLLLKWEQGYDVVHAVRRPTRKDGPLARKWRSLAYMILRRLCEVDIVPQSADFKLFDRRAVTAMCRLREHGRFNRGLAKWIGFRHAEVHYDEAPRARGRPTYSFAKRLLLLMNGIFSLSSKPLQYLGVVGLGVSALSVVYLLVVLIGWAMDVEAYRLVAGWASTVGIILLVGGVQLTGLWIMGQYLARTYDEVKGRPCYIVADTLGLYSAEAPAGVSTPRVLPRRQEGTRPAIEELPAEPALAQAPDQVEEHELQTCDHA